VLIAQGTMPRDEIPAHYVLEETLFKKEDIVILEDGSVDFKNKSPFVLVKKGQVLAKKIPYKQGEIGYNVFGSGLPYKTYKPHKIMAGKNVCSDQEVYIADCDGRFQ